MGLAGEEVEHVGKGLVEIGHVGGNQSAEEEVKKHGRDREEQPSRRGDERLANSLGEICRLGLASCERAETRNHSGCRAQKPDHGGENGKGVHVVHDHHHFGLVPETLVADVVFHGALVIHIALEVCLCEGAGQNIRHETGRGIAEAVGPLQVSLCHENIELGDEGWRHEFVFAKHEGAVAAHRTHGNGTEGYDMHDRTALAVEVHQAFIAGDAHGVCRMGCGQNGYANGRCKHDPGGVAESAVAGAGRVVTFFHVFYVWFWVLCGSQGILRASGRVWGALSSHFPRFLCGLGPRSSLRVAPD